MLRFSLIALLFASLATVEIVLIGGSSATAQSPSPPPLVPLPQSPAPPTPTRDCHQPPVTS